MPCNKTRCLKQVNPDVPDAFFRTPFEYEKDWYGCYLCTGIDWVEDTSKLIQSPSGKFARGAVNE